MVVLQLQGINLEAKHLREYPWFVCSWKFRKMCEFDTTYKNSSGSLIKIGTKVAWKCHVQLLSIQFYFKAKENFGNMILSSRSFALWPLIKPNLYHQLSLKIPAEMNVIYFCFRPFRDVCLFRLKIKTFSVGNVFQLEQITYSYYISETIRAPWLVNFRNRTHYKFPCIPETLFSSGKYWFHGFRGYLNTLIKFPFSLSLCNSRNLTVTYSKDEKQRKQELWETIFLSFLTYDVWSSFEKL